MEMQPLLVTHTFVTSGLIGRLRPVLFPDGYQPWQLFPPEVSSPNPTPPYDGI